MASRLISTDCQLPPQVTRLVVLIPLMDFNPFILAKEMSDLLGDEDKEVVYLAIPKDPSEEIILTDKLYHLYAATHSDLLRVETQMQYGSSWQKALRGLLKPGDGVVCPEEVNVRWHGLWHKPLNEVLAGAVRVPLYSMSFNNPGAQFHSGSAINRKSDRRGLNSNGHKKIRKN